MRRIGSRIVCFSMCIFSQSCNHAMALLYKVEHALSINTFSGVEHRKTKDLKTRTGS